MKERVTQYPFIPAHDLAVFNSRPDSRDYITPWNSEPAEPDNQYSQNNQPQNKEKKIILQPRTNRDFHQEWKDKQRDVELLKSIKRQKSIHEYCEYQAIFADKAYKKQIGRNIDGQLPKYRTIEDTSRHQQSRRSMTKFPGLLGTTSAAVSPGKFKLRGKKCTSFVSEPTYSPEPSHPNQNSHRQSFLQVPKIKNEGRINFPSSSFSKNSFHRDTEVNAHQTYKHIKIKTKNLQKNEEWPLQLLANPIKLQGLRSTKKQENRLPLESNLKSPLIDWIDSKRHDVIKRVYKQIKDKINYP